MTEITTSIITLVGVVASALITARLSKDAFSHELDKKIAVIETKLDAYGDTIKEHNHYAKLFAESMPVIENRMKVEENRMRDVETKLDRIEGRLNDRN